MKKQIRRYTRRVKEAPKVCYFCKDKKEVNFKDVEVLRRFTTDRGKIIGRIRSGSCAMHHRRLTIAIKHARHLALLPFVVQI